MARTRAGMMPRSSSTPSISRSATARTSASCRSACARRGWPGSWPAVSTASSSPISHREIGPDLLRHACLMGPEGTVSKHRESTYRGGRFQHWIKKSRTGSIPRSAGSGSVLKQRGHWRMRRFEVPEDNGFIAECVRLLGLRIRHQRQLADRVPAGTHRGDGDQARSRASQTMEDISHASWDDAEEKDKP